MESTIDIGAWVTELFSPTTFTEPAVGSHELEIDRYVPTFMIHDRGKSYVIEAELPEAKRDQIEVRVTTRELTLRCLHAVDRIEGTRHAFGAFTKVFVFAAELEGNAVVELVDERLVIHVAKARARA